LCISKAIARARYVVAGTVCRACDGICAVAGGPVIVRVARATASAVYAVVAQALVVTGVEGRAGTLLVAEGRVVAWGALRASVVP